MSFWKCVMRVFILVNFTNLQTPVQGEFVLVQTVADFFNTTEALCKELGLDVAKLESDEAYMQAVVLINTTHSKSNPIWIGLVYDTSSEMYRWRDGTGTSRTNWYSNHSATEQCVSIFKDWDWYMSMKPRDCYGKHYHILCGTYDPPAEVSMGMFRDVTSSKAASLTELSRFVVPSRLSCGSMCLMERLCTHYRIDSLQCTLYSGNIQTGTTKSGKLYIKL